MAGPKTSANGTRNASDQPAATLPKWWCQKNGVASGITAIDNNRLTKGSAQSADNWLPSKSAAPAIPGNIPSKATATGQRFVFIVGLLVLVR